MKHITGADDDIHTKLSSKPIHFQLDWRFSDTTSGHCPTIRDAIIHKANIQSIFRQSKKNKVNFVEVENRRLLYCYCQKWNRSTLVINDL